MNEIMSNPTTDTMAWKHSIRHTTPGAIASSVVLVCIFNCLNSMLLLTYMLNQSHWALTFYKVWVPIPELTTEETSKNTLKFWWKVFEKGREAISTSLGNGIGLFSPTQIQAWWVAVGRIKIWVAVWRQLWTCSKLTRLKRRMNSRTKGVKGEIPNIDWLLKKWNQMYLRIYLQTVQCTYFCFLDRSQLLLLLPNLLQRKVWCF